MQPVVTVGLDGSTESLAAARWAADEADKRRLTLRLLHAWPMLLPEPAHAASEVDQERRLLVVGRRAPRHSGTPHLEPVAHAAIHHGRCPVAFFPHD